MPVSSRVGWTALRVAAAVVLAAGSACNRKGGSEPTAPAAPPSFTGRYTEQGGADSCMLDVIDARGRVSCPGKTVTTDFECPFVPSLGATAYCKTTVSNGDQQIGTETVVTWKDADTISVAFSGTKSKAPPEFHRIAGATPSLPAAAGPSVAGSQKAIEDQTWSVHADKTQVGVKQEASTPTRCTLTATDEATGKTLWTVQKCVGDKVDLKFVGPDGAKLVVVHQYPKLEKDIASTPVLEVYRQGELLYSSRAGGAVTQQSAIRSAGSSFYWLAGVGDVPGQAPHYVQDGAGVEITTIDNNTFTISLADTPPAKTEAKTPAKAAKRKGTRK